MKKIIILLNNNIVIQVDGNLDIKKLYKLFVNPNVSFVTIAKKVIPKSRILAVFTPSIEDESKANLVLDIQNQLFNLRVNDFDKTTEKLEKDLNTPTNEFILVENELILLKHAFNASEEKIINSNVSEAEEGVENGALAK